jgi:hypothetical protein
VTLPADQKRLFRKLPKDLEALANIARNSYSLPPDEEEGNTNFYFMHRLSTEETSQADFLLRWFRETIESALSFVKTGPLS